MITVFMLLGDMLTVIGAMAIVTTIVLFVFIAIKVINNKIMK